MVILFWAKWYPECEELLECLEKIAQNLQHIIICWCDVLTEKEIVEHFEVSIIPYIILMHPKKKHIEYIRTPKAESLAKVLGAYEEYYRLSFVNE